MHKEEKGNCEDVRIEREKNRRENTLIIEEYEKR